jgi:hypothetical protein
MLAGSVGLATQGSDNCTGLYMITSVPYADSGSTVGQVNDFTPPTGCSNFSSTAPDVIYGFIPPYNGTFIFSLCGSRFNSVMFLRAGGDCPGTSAVACNDNGCNYGASEIRATLNAGVTYYLIIDGFRTVSGSYMLNITEAPCQSELVTAPLVLTATTCGAGNGCGFVTSENRSYAVTIPATDDWIFKLCENFNSWPALYYLSTGCCDPLTIFHIEQPRCGLIPPDHPDYRAHLNAGVCYVTVEKDTMSGNSEPCGPFTLDIHLSRGRCCYEENLTTICTVTGPSVCAALGGVYDEDMTCASPCPVFPHCQEHPLVSQPPLFPEECPMCWGTSEVGVWQSYDDFHAVTQPISSVRFWGILHSRGVSDSLLEDPAFRVSFYADNNGTRGDLTQQYDLSVYGTRQNTYYHDAYGYLRSREFTAVLDPPCTQSDGWISIQGAGDPATEFYWLLSSESPVNWAFCLGESCQKADSLTLLYQPELNQLRLDFYAPQAGRYKLMACTSPQSMDPGSYHFVQDVAAQSGHNTVMGLEPAEEFCSFMLVQDCSVSPAADPGRAEGRGLDRE